MSIRVNVSSTGNLMARAEAAAQKAFQNCMKELNAEFYSCFSKNVWDWPRQLPDRKLEGATLKEVLANYKAGKGITPPNPRNILDFGNPGLRGSKYMEFTGPYECVFKWSAPYAHFVHEGGFMWAWNRRPPLKGARAVFIPPRPWTKAVLGTQPVPGINPYPLGQRLKDVWLTQLRKG